MTRNATDQERNDHNRDYEKNDTDVELRFTIARLRGAIVELLLLEEDHGGDYRDIIARLDGIVLKLLQGRRF
jgi:hypothetical protein